MSIQKNPKAPTSGAAEKGEETLRRVPAKTIGLLKRQMDGAEKRMIRLQAELSETRAKIRRKYTDVFDANENIIGRNMLSSEGVYGYRLKRTQIEKELAVVKGEFFQLRKAYRSAVSHNFKIERKTVKLIRKENKIRRESAKSLKLVKETLKTHGKNGGAKDLQLLTSLALEDDVKGFRAAFDESVGRFEPKLYTTISGVSQVKTEIIHAVMQDLAEEAKKNQNGNLSDAVRGQN